MSLHAVVAEAARGGLPTWAVATDARRGHVARVADLLEEWARAFGGGEETTARWRAVGVLHDALRDEDPEVLRVRVPPLLRGLPPKALHGPAAAQRLWADGVTDGPLLRAVSWHTLGHPELDDMGRALYAADFLEPGRDLLNDWRAGLRARFPKAPDEVVREILQARIRHLLEGGRPVCRQTMDFWNSMAEEAG